MVNYCIMVVHFIKKCQAHVDLTSRAPLRFGVFREKLIMHNYILQ